jgi:hypothetical protein
VTEAVSETTTTDDSTSLATETPEAGATENSAWAPLLDALPDSLRNLEQIQNPLREWDKNYQQLQEQYAPFKDLPEQYRDPQLLNNALQVWQNIEQNPHQVLRILADSLGVSLAEAQAIVQEQQQEPPAPVEFDDDDDPRLKALQQQIEAQKQQFDQFFEQQTAVEQERIQNEAANYEGQKMDDQVRQLLEAGHLGDSPELQKDMISDLMQRAYALLQNGSNDPIMDAFKSQQAFTSTLAKRFTGTAPPQQNLLFLPTGGTPPSNAPQAPNLDTQEGRYAYARQIRDSLAQQ